MPSRTSLAIARVALLLPLVLVACGDADPTATPTPPVSTASQPPAIEAATPLPTPRPGEGFQVKVGGWTLAPGEDATTCTYINGMFDEVQAVNGSMILQQAFGHHLSVYAADEHEEDGTRPCYGTDAAMSGWTLIAGNFKQGNLAAYPPGIAIALDPTKTLIINTHHVNWSDEPAEVDDAVNVYTIPVESVENWLGSYLMFNFDIDVQPNAGYRTTATCPIPFDMSVVVLMGHMHEWGTNIEILRGHDGADSVLYTGLPTVTDPSIGGMVTYFDKTLDLQRGDQISWTCDWFNTSDQALAFPTEMCAVIMTYYPQAEQQLQCFKEIEQLAETEGGE